MTIWLKAYVWTEDENLKFRRKADRMVRLVCPSLNVFAGMRDGWAGLGFRHKTRKAHLSTAWKRCRR